MWIDAHEVPRPSRHRAPIQVEQVFEARKDSQEGCPLCRAGLPCPDVEETRKWWRRQVEEGDWRAECLRLLRKQTRYVRWRKNACLTREKFFRLCDDSFQKQRAFVREQNAATYFKAFQAVDCVEMYGLEGRLSVEGLLGLRLDSYRRAEAAWLAKPRVHSPTALRTRLDDRDDHVAVRVVGPGTKTVSSTMATVSTRLALCTGLVPAGARGEVATFLHGRPIYPAPLRVALRGIRRRDIPAAVAAVQRALAGRYLSGEQGVTRA